jgi:hypothetical protein
MPFNIVRALNFNLVEPMVLFQRVMLTKDIDLLPHTTLCAGETGEIVALESDQGGVWQIEVLLDTFHHGLLSWGNEALLAFPELSSVIVVMEGQAVMFT